MNATLEKLSQFGIVPVAVLDDAKDAVPFVKFRRRRISLWVKVTSAQRRC